MPDDTASGGSFWSSLPGVLTALGTLIAACTGLYLALGTKPTPTQSTPQSGNGQPPPGHDAQFRVVEMILRADPFNYSGKCPVTIRLSGRVSAVGGNGSVAYKFLRSDGASAPVQSLVFHGAGSQDVSTTWTLGASYSGWQQIEVLSPAPGVSGRADFKIQCE